MESTIHTLERLAPSHLWQRITSVARFVNQLPDGTIVVGTARRAICLLDALATLGIVRPDRQMYASRVLDIEPTMFKDQDVLLVEDMVTSTRTLSQTIDKLTSSSVKSLRNVAFAINVDYPANKNIEFEDLENTLALSGDQAADFGNGILDLISVSGRTYNIDWPILTSSGNPQDFLDAALNVPGWSSIESTSTDQANAHTHAFTFYPKSVECSSLLVPHIALTKVRAVLTRRGTKYTLRLIPIVALRRLSSDWETIVQTMQPDLPLGRWASQAYVQHLLSLDLCRIFIDNTNAWIARPLTFRESSRTLSLAYGHSLPSLLLRIGKKSRRGSAIGQSCPVPNDHASEVMTVSVADPVLASEADLILSNRFFKYYQDSGEKLLRDKAQTGDLDAVKRLIQTEYLLDTGLSVDDLESVLIDAAMPPQEARSGVSAFLDRAIDSGLVVPVIATDGRRFRPGEAAMFNDRARRQCEVLLAKMQAEAQSLLEAKQQTASTAQAGMANTLPPDQQNIDPAAGSPTLMAGSATLSQFLIQKSLVLLWKYGTKAGLLDKNGSGELVSVQYYTHGAMLDAADAQKAISTGNSLVTRVLEASQFLVPIEGKGYAVQTGNALQGLSAATEARVRILGAQAIYLSRRTTRDYRDEEEYILWISTSDLGQAPLALGADVSLARVEFEAACTFLMKRPTSTKNSLDITAPMRRQNWYAALTAGWRKSLWLLKNESERFEEAKRAGVQSEYEASFLEDIIDAVHGSPAPSGALGLRDQAMDWLLSARLCFMQFSALHGTEREYNVLAKHVSIAREAISVDPGSYPFTASTVALLDQGLNEVQLLQGLEPLFDCLKDLGRQIATWTQAATGRDGRVEDFVTYAGAALLKARPSLSLRTFTLDLRDFARATKDYPRGLIVDFTESLGIEATFGICAKGPDAARSVIDATTWLMANRPHHFEHGIIFANLRAHQVIARSATTSQIFCDSFRAAARTLLANPLPCTIELVGTTDSLPSSLRTLDSGRADSTIRRYFHESIAIHADDFERRGFDLEPARESTTRKTAMGNSKLAADILVFAPMAVERTAFLSAFGLSLRDLSWLDNKPGRPIYALTLTNRNNKPFRAVMVIPGSKGPAGARDAVARSLELISPTYISICGIGGGIDKTMGFGDVVIGRGIVPYEYIKETREGIEVVAADMLPLAQIAESMYAGLEVKPVDIHRDDGMTPAVISYAPIASGHTVLKDELGDVRRYLTAHPSRPLIAEMESAAILQELRSLGPSMLGRAIVVRGVSDLADSQKGDSFHGLAAANAAKTFRAMLDQFSLG